MKAMVVCGYVEDAFPARHLSPGKFKELGGRLKAALPGKVIAYDEGWTLNSCWANLLLHRVPLLAASDPNPPADRYATRYDALVSNVVLLQRYAWMALAAAEHPDVDTFAWLEYSILKQRGVTEKIVQDFILQVEQYPFDAISYPGQMAKQPFTDDHAHWRFSGSTWVCPRNYASPLFYAVKDVVRLRADLTGHVSWDMNTAAFVELLDVLPFRWYPGAHDETQMTNYLKSP
jgi:hypothetical protein